MIKGGVQRRSQWVWTLPQTREECDEGDDDSLPSRERDFDGQMTPGLLPSLVSTMTCLTSQISLHLASFDIIVA